MFLDGTIGMYTTSDEEAEQEQMPQRTSQVHSDPMHMDDPTTDDYDYSDESLRLWLEARTADAARDDLFVTDDNVVAAGDDFVVTDDDNDTNDNYEEIEDSDLESPLENEGDADEERNTSAVETNGTTGEGTAMEEDEPLAYVDPWDREPPLPIDTPIIQKIYTPASLPKHLHMSFELYS